MSSLTEQERLGLDEVFLSISTRHDKDKRWSDLKGSLKGLVLQARPVIKRYQPLKILFHVQKRLKSSIFIRKISEKRKKKRELRK